MPVISPTVEDLQRYILEHELPLRSRTTNDAETVLRYGAFVGSVFAHHDFLNRAMDRAREIIDRSENADRSVSSGTVIIAGTLDSARGRFTRSWHAPAGGLWGCLIHANTFIPDFRRFISLAVGVACCEAVRQIGLSKANLRWVNDVLVERKKVAGFLIQGYSGPKRHGEYDLIGFGINVNNDSFPEELQTTAISLAQALGHPVDLDTFTLIFLAKLSWNMGLLYAEEAHALREHGISEERDEPALLKRWKELSDTVGRRVVYGFNVFETPLYQATVMALQGDGSLLLRLDDGSFTSVQSGEIRYL